MSCEEIVPPISAVRLRLDGIGSEMLPFTASPARTALSAAHFDRSKIPRISIPRISGTGH